MLRKLLIVFLALTTNCLGQKNQQPKPEILQINGKKSPYVHVGRTNLYASKFEVSNNDYLTFLNWTRKNKGEAEYLSNLPDTAVWKSISSYSESFFKYYFRHPAFKHYPVVGVNYAQALNYCTWLSNSTNELLTDKKIRSIHFRLPTEEEWEIAARGGLPEGTIFPWGNTGIRIEKGKSQGLIRANFGYGDYMGVVTTLNDLSDVTKRVESYWPNNFDLYNVAGNVAEMVADPSRTSAASICKGGSWKKGGNKMVISSRDTFDRATAWVGFRVFAEIEEYQVPDSKIKVNAEYIENQIIRIPVGFILKPRFCTLFEPDTSQSYVHVGGFYISKYEVNNELYLQFLNSIKDSLKRNQYAPKDENWKHETDLLQYQNYSSQFPNHPVVNITKEAMNAFCTWLSAQYNNDPKRKYEHVEFSLPTAEEQIRVMSGNFSEPDFSWGGPSYTNAKGIHLMNFNPLLDYVAYDEERLTNDLEYRKTQLPILKKSRALDGYELTAPVGSFKSNAFGIFNEHGNVAEALSNYDYVLGGSFASMHTNCSNSPIYGSNYYEVEPERIALPSSQVGFRFVMNDIFDQVDHGKNSAPVLLTPNGDGKNDVFELHGVKDYPDNELTVFDGRGNLVYLKKGYQNTWAGECTECTTPTEAILPTGMYFYIFKKGPENSKRQFGYISFSRE